MCNFIYCDGNQGFKTQELVFFLTHRYSQFFLLIYARQIEVLSSLYLTECHHVKELLDHIGAVHTEFFLEDLGGGHFGAVYCLKVLKLK